MTKRTLDNKIGDFTTSSGGLFYQASDVTEAVKRCYQKTKYGKPRLLIKDLLVLRHRLGSMIEMTDDALARCAEIITSKEPN
jgi:hypothetical protein